MPYTGRVRSGGIVKIARPYPHIFHLSAPRLPGILGEVDLAFHFLRFQEHYESPRFKGSVFSWGAYVAWYKQARGSFSYPWDWSGFNFPGQTLGPFRRGAFDPLTRREKALLTLLAGVTDQDYVIATFEDDKGSLDHELAHAFWHLDPAYRAAIEAILAGADHARQKAALAEGDGYDPAVFLDEIQACAVQGHRDFAPDKGRRAQIRALFKARCAKLK
jgi:hypothetical protein